MILIATCSVKRSLTEPFPMVLLLREELSDHADELAGFYEETLFRSSEPDGARLRAAMMLAAYRAPDGAARDSDSVTQVRMEDSDGGRDWLSMAEYVVDPMLQQIAASPQDFTVLQDGFAIAKEGLIPTLAARSQREDVTAERSSATGMLIHYTRADLEALTHYMLDAQEDQFALFLDAFDDRLIDVSNILMREAFLNLDESVEEEEYDRLAKSSSCCRSSLASIKAWGIDLAASENFPRCPMRGRT